MKAFPLLAALLIVATLSATAQEDLYPDNTAEHTAQKWVAIINGFASSDSRVTAEIARGDVQVTIANIRSVRADGRLLVFTYQGPDGKQRQAAVEVSNIVAISEWPLRAN